MDCISWNRFASSRIHAHRGGIRGSHGGGMCHNAQSIQPGSRKDKRGLGVWLLRILRTTLSRRTGSLPNGLLPATYLTNHLRFSRTPSLWF